MPDIIDFDRDPEDRAPRMTRSRTDGLPPEVSDDEAPELKRPPKQRGAQTVVNLKLAGATFAEIAKVMEYPSAAVARSVFEAAIVASGEQDIDYKTLRAIANARLEGLLKSIYPRAIDQNETDQLAFQRQALSILDREAKLNGLDAPTRVEVYTPTQDEFTQIVMAASKELAPIVKEADIFSDTFMLEQAPDGETWRKEDEDVQ